MQELGADVVIDYRTQTFEDLLQNYDAVFDTVGGDTYRRSFKVLKKGGVIVSVLEQAQFRANESIRRQSHIPIHTSR